jgi:hypothetical protein
MTGKEVIGDDHPQDRVSEKFQPLIGGEISRFRTPGSVRQGKQERSGFGKSVTQTINQRGDGLGAQDLSPASP